MRQIGIVIMTVIAFAACKPKERVTPPPAHASASQVALSGAAVFVGAGDIGVCGAKGDEQTAALVDSIIKADSAVHVESVVFTVGDNAYPAGLDRDFVRCFKPSWGDPNKRIMKLIRPTIGNHDYQSQRGAAYYRYFGARGPGVQGLLQLRHRRMARGSSQQRDRGERNTVRALPAGRLAQKGSARAQ